MLSLLEHKGRKIYSSQSSRIRTRKEVVFEDGADFLWLGTEEKAIHSEEPPTQTEETHISRYREESMAGLIDVKG